MSNKYFAPAILKGPFYCYDSPVSPIVKLGPHKVVHQDGRRAHVIFRPEIDLELLGYRYSEMLRVIGN